MRTTILSLAATATLLLLGSCSKSIDAETDIDEEPNSILNIVTRDGDGTSGDNTSSALSSGQIYIFSGDNCVSTLSFDQSTAYSTQPLPAGSYTVYAIGGNDMTRFDLPTKDDARADSPILLKSGMTLDDLLMQKSTVTLTAGETNQLNMTLERKVIRIDQVTIKQVPQEVTKVEVAIAPLLTQLSLNGNYAAETTDASLTLANTSGSTWQLSSQELYYYPSDGKPTITVRFTWATDVKSYSYQSSIAWPANHKVKIEGTYTASQGVGLSGTLTGSEWGEDIVEKFEFDENGSSGSGESNQGGGGTTEAPAVGSLYDGHFVVAVEGKQVTLVSNSQQKSFNTGSKSSVEAISLLENEALSSWSTNDDVSGTWRIPTAEEAGIFLTDDNCPSVSYGQAYYCLDEEQLKSQYTNSNKSLGPLTASYGSETILRPVITITIQ